ncbi:PAS domain-containing protein [Ferrovibrio sp.]|uniref:PAS domain-containing protein n=1 Tax=Ferrovibrio sp. TaxID=1917215 RepID=UPI003D0CC767
MHNLPLTSNRLRRLFAYWQETAGTLPYPSRADIDPTGMTFILGDLILMDVLAQPGGGSRYRYRLYGSNVVQRQGFDLTGQFLDLHPWPEFAAEIIPCYDRVVAGGQPEIFTREQALNGRSFRHQSLLLPLGQDGAVTMLLIGVAFEAIQQL